MLSHQAEKCLWPRLSLGSFILCLTFVYEARRRISRKPSLIWIRRKLPGTLCRVKLTELKRNGKRNGDTHKLLVQSMGVLFFPFFPLNFLRQRPVLLDHYTMPLQPQVYLTVLVNSLSRSRENKSVTISFNGRTSGGPYPSYTIAFLALLPGHQMVSRWLHYTRAHSQLGSCTAAQRFSP